MWYVSDECRDLGSVSFDISCGPTATFRAGKKPGKCKVYAYDTSNGELKVFEEIVIKGNDIPPFNACKATLALSAIDAGGKTVWIPDLAVQVAGDGVVTIGPQIKTSNVECSGGGTVLPNSNYRGVPDQKYIWNVSLNVTVKDKYTIIDAKLDAFKVKGTISIEGNDYEFECRISWHMK